MSINVQRVTDITTKQDNHCNQHEGMSANDSEHSCCPEMSLKEVLEFCITSTKAKELIDETVLFYS